MHAKKLMTICASVLALTGIAKAQFLDGSIIAANLGTGGAATASSLTLNTSNTVMSVTGGFAALVPLNGILSGKRTTINGLSTTALPDSISNYFIFSFPAPFTTDGTTPPGRFDFDLQTITEDSFNLGTGGSPFFWNRDDRG